MLFKKKNESIIKWKKKLKFSYDIIFKNRHLNAILVINILFLNKITQIGIIEKSKKSLFFTSNVYS